MKWSSGLIMLNKKIYEKLAKKNGNAKMRMVLEYIYNMTKELMYILFFQYKCKVAERSLAT